MACRASGTNDSEDSTIEDRYLMMYVTTLVWYQQYEMILLLER